MQENQKTVALIKFTDRADFNRCVTADFLKKMVEDKEKSPVDWDQIFVLGNVSGTEVLEVRFVKFKKNEQ